MFDLKAKFILAAVLLIGGVSAASAQLVDGTVLKFTANSEFSVKDKVFAPGEYTIQRVGSSSNSASLLVLRGKNGGSIAFDTIMDHDAAPAKATEVVFYSIGGTNVLSKIVVKGESGSNEVPRTAAQRQAIAKGASPKRVMVTQDTGL